VNSPPGARPIRSSAERPAPTTKPEVFLRDFDGERARRIPAGLADRLVSAGIAERVSCAGHVRLKLGIRFLPNGDLINGIPAIELSRFYRGDAATVGDLRHKDHQIGH
jgi:hypothetical protein